MEAAIHAASHGTYERLRVHAELVHGYGVRVGHNTVQLLTRRPAWPNSLPTDAVSAHARHPPR